MSKEAEGYATIPGKYEYVGRTVDYEPTPGQTYNIAATTYSGYNTAQSFSTSDITGGWKVWDMDDKNIYLISTQSTGNGSKKLTLQNYQGYNNGVTLLDQLCDTCYTNKTSYSGMKGRSLKLSDITAVTTVENGHKDKYGTRTYQYNFAYPWIWAQYEKSDTSVNQGASDWENNRETAYNLTTNTTTSSTYNPYYSLWYNGSMNTASAWIHKAYYDMVMTPVKTSNSSNNYYWLSSRYVNHYSSTDCNFGLQIVNSRGVYDGMGLYNRKSGSASSSGGTLAVRPLVSIPLSSCYLTEGGTNGEDLHIGSMKK